VAPQKRIRPEDNTFRDFAFGAGSALAGGFLGQYQQEKGLEFLANNIPGGGSNRSALSSSFGTANLPAPRFGQGGSPLGFTSPPPIGSIGGNASTDNFGLSSLGFIGQNPFGLAGLAAGFKPF
jgi:hypothetical protein